MASRRAPRWRSLLAWLFLLLFCLAAPLALLTGWARVTVASPEVYARAVRAAGEDPRVQEGMRQAVIIRSQALLIGENPTATEAVQARVIAQALGEAVREVVASPAFGEVWEAANQEAYGVLVSALGRGWGQPVVLDLSPLTGPLQREIDALGVALPDDLTIDPAMLRIEVLDAQSADRLRRGVAHLTLAFWGSLAATGAALALTIVLAPDRLAALGRAGFGLAIAMVAFIALLLAAQAAAAAAAGDAGGDVALVVIVDGISGALRLAAVGLALGGLLVAGVCAGVGALGRGAGRPG